MEKILILKECAGGEEYRLIFEGGGPRRCDGE